MVKSKQTTDKLNQGGYTKTQKMVILALITAISYVVLLLFRISIIPSVPFLSLEFKSSIILIGSYMFGPLCGFLITVIVSLIEMLTISGTGLIGCIMNIIATACFVCPAAFVYKKKKNTFGAVTGLVLGTVMLTVAMVLWNYIATPIYMGIPREAIVELLLPAFIPFNLIKGVVNGAVTILLYKFVFAALKKAKLLPESIAEAKSSASSVAGVIILSCVVLATCVLIILAFNGVF